MQKGFIICVDDQPKIVGSLLTQLEHAVGHACEIEVAESATEALEVLVDLEERGEQVDIVITDEIMPGMQGSQFAEAIVHSITDGILVFDKNDRISLVNKACTEILGYSEQELQGKRILDVIELKELIMLLC